MSTIGCWLFIPVSLEGGDRRSCRGVCCGWWVLRGLRDVPALQVQQRVHGGCAVSQHPPQFPPAPISRAENVTQRHGLTRQLRTHGATQEGVIVEDADFRHVPGIDPEGHGFPHVGRQRGREVAEPLEVNAIGPHVPRLRHLNQQQIQLLQRVRHARKKAVGFPALDGGHLRVGMVAPVIDVEEERAELRLERRHRQRWGASHPAAHWRVALQLAQEHLVHRAEEAFDPPTPSRLAWDGEDQSDVQIRAHLFQVSRPEVAPVVGVEDIGDAAHTPARIVLAPHRLAKRERRVQGGRCFEREKVARHGAAVVVDDRGEPRLGGGTIRAHQQDVEQRVVGLPDGVGPICFPPVDQLERLTVRRRPLVRECHQVSGQGRHDAIDDPVARRGLTQVLRNPPGLATNRRYRERRFLECDALDGVLERGRQLAVLAGVRPFLSRQGRQAELAIPRHPPLCGAKRNVGRRRDDLQ